MTASRRRVWPLAVLGLIATVVAVGAAPAQARGSARTATPTRPSPPVRDPRSVEGQPIRPKGPDARVDRRLRPTITESRRALPPGPVDVEILHAASASTSVQAGVVAAGGMITGQVPGSLVQARVPAESLEDLAAIAGVQAVRPPVDINVVDAAPLPRAGSVPGQPVGKTLADQWHAAGITGAGINVGIIDVFESTGWNAAVASGDVPNINLATQSFCLASGTACTIFQGASRHGNAVAEIVHDMAPGANLFLVYVQTTSDLRAAVDWMAAKGVTIVNRSQGAPLDGPGNGAGALGDVASYAVTKGITFFNSAGNAASGGYWRGTWSDPDGNGFLNFNAPGQPADELMAVSVYPCAVALGFRWSDWGPASTRTDYDVYLDTNFDGQVNGLDLGWEADQQLGAPPIEMAAGLLGNCSGGAQTVQMAVRLYARGSGTAGDVLELLVNSAGLEYWSKPYSATQPISDSGNPGVVSVGAIEPWNGTTLASYSSQGPTNDGRMKPDLSAPSCVATLSYGSACFNGTSAASPVAAGAAALVRQGGFAADAPAVRAFLTSTAVDRGAPGVENEFGWGEVSLPALPPASFAKGAFTAVTPFRLVDTRSGQGGAGGRVAPGNVLKARVLGQGSIPAGGVSAVVVNVTANDTAGAGFLQVYPHAWATLGGSSNLNADQPSQTIAGLTVVPVGLDGKIAVYDQPGSHVIIDVFGYFTQASTSRAGRYEELAPARIYDTRAGGGKAPAGALITIPVAQRGGIPGSGVSAVVLNLTATQADAAGYVQVLPGTSGAPASYSNLNLVRPYQTVANLVVVPLDSSGNARLYTFSRTHLIVDVMGYFTDGTAPQSASGLFTPIRPTRLRDTRATGGPVPPAGRLVVNPLANPALAGTNPAALFLNVTATQATGPGFVQVYPTGAAVEGASSNLNVEAKGQTMPNAVTAALGSASQFTIFTQGGGHLIADAAGWFAT